MKNLLAEVKKKIEF